MGTGRSPDFRPDRSPGARSDRKGIDRIDRHRAVLPPLPYTAGHNDGAGRSCTRYFNRGLAKPFSSKVIVIKAKGAEVRCGARRRNRSTGLTEIVQPRIGGPAQTRTVGRHLRRVGAITDSPARTPGQKLRKTVSRSLDRALRESQGVVKRVRARRRQRRSIWNRSRSRRRSNRSLPRRQ